MTDELKAWAEEQAYERAKAEYMEKLYKIRDKIDSYCSDNRDRNDGLYIAMKIIDKHIKEIEGCNIS